MRARRLHAAWAAVLLGLGCGDDGAPATSGSTTQDLPATTGRWLALVWVPVLGIASCCLLGLACMTLAGDS